MNSPDKSTCYNPTALIILDGWGVSEKTDNNAIYHAKKPTWDKLWEENPHTLIHGSGSEVGLPANQMGNSEVGHLNLGAGRVVNQELTRIDKAVEDGSFFDNKVLIHAIDQAITNHKAVHIMGLLSNGGVHSHESQIKAAITLAMQRGAKKVYLHAFLDGRDTPPKSAAPWLTEIDTLFAAHKHPGRIASIIGRFFALDRDNRWERIQAAYELMTQGKSAFQATSAIGGLDAAYQRGETDEFVQATSIIPAGEDAVSVESGDTMIFMNFRADRARQISQAFAEPEFTAFTIKDRAKLGAYISLTEYKKSLETDIVFPATRMKNVFGEYISNQGLRQLRISETEKYAHVTFFFNGGEERAFEGEERILIESPKVKTYDLQPEMSAAELTDKLVEAIASGKFDTIICNYANPDMVGHTGNLEACIKAIETIDACLARVHEAITAAGGELLITADHGNAEKMSDDKTGQAHTAHTANPVPLLYIGRDAEISDGGSLSDIAPTMLYLMGLEKPTEMTGRSLLKLK
ncbi:MAG: 2,3-bisphosphoglycerate-independent phosphoglycerate mutase [Thiotrichaceae bacterium]|nr:2,3-bisphosphoglycerate-independent phosphoglycerate mutase [Thiotrichaceae bacterium]